jgi:transaldolase
VYEVTLLFSCDHYVAAAQAYLRGLERRAAMGLDLKVESVASFFVGQWDVAAEDEISGPFRNRLGAAIAARAYKAYGELQSSERWRALEAAGARPQRLAWAGTGTPDPAVSDTLYVEALAAPGTIDAVPERTLLAFADHGNVGAGMLADAGYAEEIIAKFRHDGLDEKPLAKWLQREGVGSLAKSWHGLLARIEEKARPTELSMPAIFPC